MESRSHEKGLTYLETICFFDMGQMGIVLFQAPKHPIVYFPQISDTSTSTSRGSLATSTVSRAGGMSPK
jgi:hypothetical protein